MNHRKSALRGAFFLSGMLLAAPLALAAEPLPSVVSAAAESNHVICGGAAVRAARCYLRSAYVTSGAVGGYVLSFNAITAPADGAVTPQDCVILPANSTVSINFGETADLYVTGLTLVFSSTGCFTKTASATAYFKARVQ